MAVDGGGEARPTPSSGPEAGATSDAGPEAATVPPADAMAPADAMPPADATPAADAGDDTQSVVVPERPARTARGLPGRARAAAGRCSRSRAPGEVTDDFYRLPFPNDLRRVNGKLDLGELPSRPAALPPFDLVAKYLAAAAEEGSGFGLHPVVFFRFSRKPAVGSGAGVHQAGAVGFVDVTPGAPERGQVIRHRVRLAPDSRYLCASALAIEPATAAPLLPGHTYAVWLTAP